MATSVAAKPKWGGVAMVAVGLGCVALVPWLFVTMIEVDTGWGDAIWSDTPWNLYAWSLTLAGTAGALYAVVAARRYRRRGAARDLRWCGVSLVVEVLAAAGWVWLAFAAVS